MSKIQQQAGCIIFVGDNHCRKILNVSPTKLLTHLSSESFGLSVAVLQDLVGYLLTISKRDNVSAYHSSLIRHLAPILCKLLKCRRVFAWGKDKFDILTLKGEDKATLATIRGSDRPMQQVTTFLQYEDALLLLAEAHDEWVAKKQSLNVDSGELLVLKERVEHAAETIVQARANRAVEHESIVAAAAAAAAAAAKNSRPKTLYLDDDDDVEANYSQAVEPPHLTSILERSQGVDAETSVDKVIQMKERHSILISSILNERSIESMDFKSIVERLDKVVDDLAEDWHIDTLRRASKYNLQL